MLCSRCRLPNPSVYISKDQSFHRHCLESILSDYNRMIGELQSLHRSTYALEMEKINIEKKLFEVLNQNADKITVLR